MISNSFKSLIEKFNISEVEITKQQSYDWFRKKITPGLKKELTLKEVQALNADWGKSTSKSAVHRGWFYTFIYDPKTKKTLPYYDKFPLILMLKTYKNGFLGLNFHYLSPKDRALFMDKLLVYEKKIKITKDNYVQMININYQTLKASGALKFYKPCIKRYLYSHIGAFFTDINSEEWKVMIWLPTEQFKKQSKVTVWTDSRKLINKM